MGAMQAVTERRRVPWWRRCHRRLAEGQTLVIFALMLPVLAGITGIAIDAGNLYFQRRNIQSIADTAALTGAQVANFNAFNPAILDPEGENQAIGNAVYNGLVASEVVAYVPPQTVPSESWNNDSEYIEVIVTRQVNNSFMGIFGQWTVTLHARAVARCIKPGWGEGAVLALSPSPTAITFNGCGVSSCQIVGDILSAGGIEANGNASNFQISGAAYSMTQPAETNLTTTEGSFGTDTPGQLSAVADPIVEGTNAQPPSVVWPYGGNFTLANMGNGPAYVCHDPWPSTTAGADCPNQPLPPPPPETVDTDDDDVNISPTEYAVFTPGYYGDVHIAGNARFQRGVYSFNTFTFGAGATASDQGAGVLIHVRDTSGGGNGEALDASGAAQFSFSPLRITDTASPCAGYTCQWRNIVFYVPNGNIDLTGTGTRVVNGSIYAPNGSVDISGNGGASVVNGGQVIAQTVNFSGNGPLVDFGDIGDTGTFAPVIVNVPQ